MTQIKQAIEIFEKYELNVNWLSAEHDVVYFPTADLSEEDKQALKAMGFHWSNDADCWAGFV